MKKKVFRERYAEPKEMVNAEVVIVVEDAKKEDDASKKKQNASVQVIEPKKRGRKKSVK